MRVYSHCQRGLATFVVSHWDGTFHNTSTGFQGRRNKYVLSWLKYQIRMYFYSTTSVDQTHKHDSTCS